MVLPVQEVRGISGDANAELAFGLQDRGVGVTWILPPRLRDALAGSPSLDVRIERLPVGMFTSGEVRRVGDPLYGSLLRLSTLVSGEVALVPVRAVAQPTEDGAVAVSLWVALIHVRTGRVMWFGVVEGSPFPPGDPRGLASAVDRLARTLLWYTAR